MKMTLYVTNLTDSFRLIKPNNFSCKSDSMASVLPTRKKNWTIPPKGNVRIRLRYRNSGMRTDKLTFRIDTFINCGTTKNIYTFPEIPFDIYTVKDIKNKSKPTYTSGNVTLTILDADYNKKRLFFLVRVAYSGDEFLAIRTSNIKIKGKDGGFLANSNPKEHYHYFHSKFQSQKHKLIFYPPLFVKPRDRKDLLFFSNVFTEYKMIRSTSPIQFSLTKTGEGKRINIKLKKKEKQDIPLVD